MVICAHGMSAPPEVVFNTATDPDRLGAWLPPALRQDGNRPAVQTCDLSARWDAPDGWSAALQVRQVQAGGAMVRLELAAELPDDRLAQIAEASLADLARHVADNLTAG